MTNTPKLFVATKSLTYSPRDERYVTCYPVGTLLVLIEETPSERKFQIYPHENTLILHTSSPNQPLPVVPDSHLLPGACWYSKSAGKIAELNESGFEDYSTEVADVTLKDGTVLYPDLEMLRQIWKNSNDNYGDLYVVIAADKVRLAPGYDYAPRPQPSDEVKFVNLYTDRPETPYLKIPDLRDEQAIALDDLNDGHITEAVDRIFVAIQYLETALTEHPLISAVGGFNQRVQAAIGNLAALYQIIGRYDSIAEIKAFQIYLDQTATQHKPQYTGNGVHFKETVEDLNRKSGEELFELAVKNGFTGTKEEFMSDMARNILGYCMHSNDPKDYRTTK